ncbi:MAG: phosphatase PAP2 family protein, partial [Chloroflexi bacterium]|nr:phosphatase PAP2 family protein [Chloroflexota bacterium]
MNASLPTDIHSSDASYELARQFTGISLRRAVLTALTIIMSAMALALLAWWLRSHPFDSFDTSGVSSISGWDWWGVDATLDTIAAVTNAQASAIIGLLLVAILFLTGHARLAAGIAVAGFIVAVFAIIADSTLGDWVGRERPAINDDRASFPSGHALGTTAFHGFALYLGVTHKLRRALLIPLIAVVVIAIGVSGIARIHQEAHWPTDVIGGYLLGLIALFILIYIHRWMESIRWFARPILGRDVAAVPMKGVRIADSYASVVMLDSEAGTATKIFNPPFIIRVIYWMAFQAKFPYDANPAALEAARYRREIAGYLTQFRFGKNLVAPIVGLDCIGGRPAIVSRLIEGEEAPNDDAAQEFLTEVSLLFASAGLPIWQLNPRNPHAHTNIIRTPNGDQYVVDFESAVATPIPLRGQMRAAAKLGNLPVFDDVDFDRLRAFVQVNETEIRESLGPNHYIRFQAAIAEGEACTKAWQGAELRLASRMIRITYAMLNWKALFVKTKSSISDADVKAEAFLAKGLDIWVEEGRITQERAQKLKADLRTDEAHAAMSHLGAHLAITAVFRFPFGSILRPLWT